MPRSRHAADSPARAALWRVLGGVTDVRARALVDGALKSAARSSVPRSEEAMLRFVELHLGPILAANSIDVEGFRGRVLDALEDEKRPPAPPEPPAESACATDSSPDVALTQNAQDDDTGCRSVLLVERSTDLRRRFASALARAGVVVDDAGRASVPDAMSADAVLVNLRDPEALSRVPQANDPLGPAAIGYFADDPRAARVFLRKRGFRRVLALPPSAGEAEIVQAVRLVERALPRR